MSSSAVMLVVVVRFSVQDHLTWLTLTLRTTCARWKNQQTNCFLSREGDASGIPSNSAFLGLPFFYLFFSLFTHSWCFHLSSPSTHSCLLIVKGFLLEAVTLSESNGGLVIQYPMRAQIRPICTHCATSFTHSSLNLCVCLCVSAYDFEWSNLADERVAIVRGIIWLLLLR